MRLTHFTVTQLRVAATCPRIHYFDADVTRRHELAKPVVTRIWTSGGDDGAAGGALFHHGVERFNRMALAAPRVLAALEESQGSVELCQALMRFANQNALDTDALAKRPPELQRAFTDAVHGYFEELATVINYALSNGIAPRDVIDQMFGDLRRRVDVTFHVGEDDHAHVTGAIDYVYYDWRIAAHRIVDYKLTPGHHSNKDLFQVCCYALMHHHQHATEPHVAVFYLHPRRRVVELGWSQIRDQRHKVYDLLASMVAWGRYDEQSRRGLKPPGDVTYCAGCKYDRGGQCAARLGPKHEGEWDKRWQELPSTREASQIQVEVRVPAPPADDADDIDSDDSPLEPSAPVPTADTRTCAPPKGAAPAGVGSRVQRLQIGTTDDGSEGVELEPAALSTHVAVVGAAGSGKTWMAKVIAEEAIRLGVPVVAVDPQGDLVQFLCARDETQLSTADLHAQRAFRSIVEPRIFTPGSSHGIRLCLNPVRLPTPEDLAGVRASRREEEESGMLEVAAANLVSVAQTGGEEDSQRAFLFRVLSSLPNRARVGLSDIVAAIREPEALGIDDADAQIKKTERDKLARKINNLVVGPGARLFTGGFVLDFDELRTPSSEGRVPLNVIYLNALADDDQKHFFLAALAAELYRWMVTSLDNAGGRPNLLFYIDEARDFIPAGGAKPPAKQPLIRLFTQGRKYGVGCLLCTQSPRSVDYNVFGNCSTKIVGRLEAQQDVERIEEWFAQSGNVPGWVAARKGAERGTFVGRWPDMAPALSGRAFKSRPLYSAHEGAWSPDRVEMEVARASALVTPGPARS